MKAILNWLVRSSADPAKWSLTIRAVLIGFIPVILSVVSAACGFGLICLGVDSNMLNDIVNGIVNIVTAILALVAGIMFLWGIIRKIVLSAGPKP